MKQIIITLISFYQIIISPLIKQLLGVKSQCRYSLSCSHYAKEVVQKYGVVKGTRLTIKRLLSCQPFTKAYGYN